MKPWTTEHADQVFSRLIRERDPVCRRCRRRPSNDCSHFYERGHSSVRFDSRNGDGVCRPCHGFWHTAEGKKEYIEFKKGQLGMKEYIELQRFAHMTMQRSEAIIRLMKSVKNAPTKLHHGH